MHNMRLFESLDKHFKSENSSNKTIREAKNNVVLEVKFETYERYKKPEILTNEYSGETLLDALITALDELGIFQYIGCDYDMNADQIIANLEMSNGDGCEYIFHIKNLNSGDIIFEGDYNDVTFEDDELEEALSAEDARNASEAAEKAKEYFDKASKACDAILREETDIDIDDEPYIEEEKFLDYCELSYEKEGKNVKEKFNTVIEAKERRSELGLDEKTATIIAVYDSGELELIESILKDVACTSPNCEEEAKNEGLADKLRAALAGKPIPKDPVVKDPVVKDTEPDLLKKRGSLSARLKKRLQAESVEDTNKIEEAVNTLIPEKYRKYYKSISKKQACNILGVEPEDLDDEDIEGQIIGYAIAKDKYFDTLASDGEEFMYIVKFNDSDTPTLAYSAGGRTFEPSYYSGAIIDESIKPEIKKLGAKK